MNSLSCVLFPADRQTAVCVPLSRCEDNVFTLQAQSNFLTVLEVNNWCLIFSGCYIYVVQYLTVSLLQKQAQFSLFQSANFK